MDRIREIVSAVEQALGNDATPDQVESIARLVLERLGTESDGTSTGYALGPDTPDRGIVTASGPNGTGILAVLTNVLADSGAIVEEVTQTSHSGTFVLAIRIDLSQAKVPMAELRKRLRNAGASQGVRISVDRADLHAAVTRI